MKETTPDILIFDVDGVLIDNRDSFLLATAETVRWCWENLLGGTADCEGYTPEYFNLCKAHPAFNDDGVVAWALLRCMKRRMAQTAGESMSKSMTKSMKEAFPDLETWKNELNTYRRSEIVEDTARLDTAPPSLAEVRSVMEEIYYGEETCAGPNAARRSNFKGEEIGKTEGLGKIERFWRKEGFWNKDGFWKKENPAISRNWKDLGLPVGIYTGRTRREMSLAQKHLNWLDFPQDMLITSDDRILKPSPLGLETLCQRSGTKSPLFFGDTVSDKDAWLAFRKGAFVAIGPILKDEAVREGFLHFDTLEDALSALL
jgi:phosphoglycolate phosphatase-like HAD superfamily hydrolase